MNMPINIETLLSGSEVESPRLEFKEGLNPKEKSKVIIRVYRTKVKLND